MKIEELYQRYRGIFTKINTMSIQIRLLCRFIVSTYTFINVFFFRIKYS